MFVLKRNLEREEVSFDKVLKRIKTLSNGLNVNYYEVAQKVCSRIYDGVKTTELDELAAQMCSSLMLDHPDYGTLASRIIISNHQKNTSPSFSETIQLLYTANFDSNGTLNPLISDALYEAVQKHKEKLNSYIDYNRDYVFDYFGFKTLERAYLLKVNGRVVERPQHMFMRVSLGIHGNDLKDALQTYDLMSKKYFVHATPTLFNSGTRVPQLSSCYLEAMESDSIEGIYNTLKDCALISKYAGGIGLHIHNVRARNAIIRGTNGISTGIVPMLRVYNNTARYVNQCFTPDTIIYTAHGPKFIKNINPVLDLVLTADGTFKRVNQLVKNEVNKTILEIQIKHAFKPVTCTNEHQVYVWRKSSTGEKNYINAKDIKLGDYLGFPIPTLNEDVRSITPDFCRFLGLMLCLGNVNYITNISTIPLLPYMRLDSLLFIKRYLTEQNIKFKVIDEDLANPIVSWDTTDNIRLGLTSDCLYDSNGHKHIYPTWQHLPHNKLKSLLLGLFEGANPTHGSKVYFTTTSFKLAMGIRYQLLRKKIITTGHTRNNVIFDNTGFDYNSTQAEYIIAVNKTDILDACGLYTDMCICEDDDDYVIENERFIWSPVIDITPFNYNGLVYDMNVQDNHNYTTDMGLVHNSGKRNGSIAMYLEPWHADVETFIEMRKNHGNEEERARDLFYALWIPDLFMKRVKEGGVWSLMCPDVCKGLSDHHSESFEQLYESYEAKKMFVKQVNAQDLWFKILECQIETGTPYMLYKDHVNKKNNQSNLGTIKSSNLCVEIMEYSSPEETAVCNLASVCLPSYLEINEDTGKYTYNFEKLHDVVKVIVKNLNKVIDVNFYPIEKARRSNMRHRPIGIGVQGLADTFAMLKYPFESEQARALNLEIFETMYHAAVEASMELAKKYGPYETFQGSPASHGALQMDLWNVDVSNKRYDWIGLKQDVMLYGMRNSLLLAPMPTASTSQIMGFNEAFEPFTSNIYKRKTLAGEFILVNKYLIKDLSDLGLWNSDIKNKIIIDDGRIQSIKEIPDNIKELYKTVWEIKMRTIIDMAADRGPFIDQSQSMNLFVENPDFKKLSSMHFYAWSKGLKTGMYYLRTKAKAKAQQFTIDPKLALTTNLKITNKNDETQTQTQDTEQVCEACSA